MSLVWLRRKGSNWDFAQQFEDYMSPFAINDFLQPPVLAFDFDWGAALFYRMLRRPVKIDDMPGCWRSYEDIRIIISLGITRIAVTRDFILPSMNSIGEVENEILSDAQFKCEVHKQCW